MNGKLLLVAALLLAGCEGAQGPAGSVGAAGTPGEKGDKGDTGEPGPIQAPPRITAVSPASGSARNLVTLQGTALGEGAEVWFDGMQAEIVSATETELVVKPVGAEVDEPRAMQITVIARNQASNSIAWQALPSGSLVGHGPKLLRSAGPVAVTADGRTAYVSDDLGGIFRIDLETRAQSAVRLQGEAIRGIVAMAIAPEGDELFAAWPVDPEDEEEFVLGRIDLETGTAQTFERRFSAPHRLAVIGDELLAGYWENGQIQRFDRKTLDSKASTYMPNGSTNFAGFGLIEETLYIVRQDGAVFSVPFQDGGTPTQLTLTGVQPNVYGVSVDGEVLRLYNPDRELVVDLDAGTVAEVAPRFDTAGWPGNEPVRLADGRWLFGESMNGVLAMGGTSDVLSPVLVALSLVDRPDGVYAAIPLCALYGQMKGGFWKIDDDGLSPVLAEVCSFSVQELPDGRMLLLDVPPGGPPEEEEQAGSAQLIAYDATTGESETLLEDASFGWGTVVGEEYIYLLNIDHTVDRLPLDGGEIERAWGTTLDTPTNGIERDGKLLIHSYTGFETIDLEEGGPAEVLWETTDDMENLGELVEDQDGNILYGTGFGINRLEDDRATPILSNGTEWNLDNIVYTVEPAPSGDLLLTGPGYLRRLVP